MYLAKRHAEIDRNEEFQRTAEGKHMHTYNTNVVDRPVPTLQDLGGLLPLASTLAKLARLSPDLPTTLKCTLNPQISTSAVKATLLSLL